MGQLSRLVVVPDKAMLTVVRPELILIPDGLVRAPDRAELNLIHIGTR